MSMYKGYRLTAGLGSNTITASMSGSGISSSRTAKSGGVLAGFVSNKESELRKIYSDIYYHDSIGGAAVDLISDLAFSPFELTDVPDEVKKVFDTKLANFNFETFLPELSLDYHVYGAFTGSLNFDGNSKAFNGIIPHDLDSLTMTEVPLYGSDPLLDLKPSKSLMAAFNSSDPRMKALMKNAPKYLNSNSSVPLDPATTLFIARRSMASDNSVVSYYRRILPYYLLETAILKGSITQAQQRQRAILMLTVGDDDWEPTQADLQGITDIFQNANADPLGAIVALRQGVNAEEVMQGGDFWKIDDIYDSMSTMKMRALGMNDSMLSGEGSWNNAEQAVESFLMYLESHRATVCRRVFYDKIFPLISITNDLNKDAINTSQSAYDQKHVDIHRIEASLASTQNEVLTAALENIDYARYYIPKVVWQKQLAPKSDTDFMDVLDSLSDADIPIPMRMYAQAAGIDFSTLLNSLDEDVNDRFAVAAYQDKVDNGEVSTDTDEFGDNFDPSQVEASVGSSNTVKRVGLNKRDFKPFSRKERRLAEKQDRMLAASLKSVAQKLEHQANEHHKKSSTKTISVPTSKPNVK